MADMPSKGQSPYGPTVKAYIDNGDAGVASDLEDHEDSTTGVHGIPDTSLLETQAGAQAKANSAKSGAEGTAAANLTAHVTKASGAHAATAISYAGGTLLPPGTVEGALDALEARVTGDFTGDINTLIDSATYRALAATNAPIVGESGFLEVTRRASTVMQEFTLTRASVRRFIRRSNDAGATWSPWLEVAVKGDLAASDIPYAGGTLLPAGTVEDALDALDVRAPNAPRALGEQDLDTLTEGLWVQSTGSKATVALNYPVENMPGFLEQFRQSSSYTMQRYTHLLSSSSLTTHAREFVRTKFGATWGPWRSVVYGGDAGGTILGTGSPLGVVSAPVGSRYTDTAATNGAREWYKAAGGSGASGWIVTNGDTGWRDISSTIDPALWTVEGVGVPAFKVRRTNDEVRVQTRVNPAADRIGTPVTSASLMTIPAGFTSDGYTPVGLAMIASGRAAGVLHTLVGVASLHFAPDESQAAKAWSTSHTLVASATFPTSVAWPSTLPGTPA